MIPNCLNTLRLFVIDSRPLRYIATPWNPLNTIPSTLLYYTSLNITEVVPDHKLHAIREKNVYSNTKRRPNPSVRHRWMYTSTRNINKTGRCCRVIRGTISKIWASCKLSKIYRDIYACKVGQRLLGVNLQSQSW